MIVTPPPVGVILAGGLSRRMGVDKAFIEIDGRAMVVRVADALRKGGCDPVVCQGGDEEIAASFGLEVVADPSPACGPLPAIRAALQHHGGPIVIAACDLADLDPGSVRAVIAAGTSDPMSLVAVAATADRRHLLSYWNPRALVPLTTAVAEGVAAYRVALDRLGAIDVSVDPAAVRNVNRPEDVARRR